MKRESRYLVRILRLTELETSKNTICQVSCQFGRELVQKLKENQQLVLTRITPVYG